MTYTIEHWYAVLPPSVRERLAEPLVVEWGFGAGPSFAATHVARLPRPIPLEVVLPAAFERRAVMRRAHLRLVDGSMLIFERLAASVHARWSSPPSDASAGARQPSTKRR